MSEFVHIVVLAFLLAALYHTNEALENDRHKTDGWVDIGVRAFVIGSLASAIAVVVYFALKELNIIVTIFEKNVAIKDGVLVFVSTFIPFFAKEVITLGRRLITKKGA